LFMQSVALALEAPAQAAGWLGRLLDFITSPELLIAVERFVLIMGMTLPVPVGVIIAALLALWI
jgi:hypothetical protein